MVRYVSKRYSEYLVMSPSLSSFLCSTSAAGTLSKCHTGTSMVPLGASARHSDHKMFETSGTGTRYVMQVLRNSGVPGTVVQFTFSYT